MNLNSALLPMRDRASHLIVPILFAFAALMLGALTVTGSPPAVLLAALFLLALIAAFTLPFDSLTLVLAVAIPFQFYFFFPGTNFAAPAAFVFVAAAALRVLIARGASGQVWMVPAAAFLTAAFIAALGASSPYDALKGIYQWLPLFACILIAAQTVDSARTHGRIILILVGLGTAQALIGLWQYRAGLDRVLMALASPLSGFFLPPNLLNERMSDLSFNWVLNGRVLPFGTFINGIDYAIFLSALMVLALERALSSARRVSVAAWLGGTIVMGAALFLTLKGSGWLAFAGGVAALGIYFAPRLSRETWLIVCALGLTALVLAAPLVGSISERAAFLIEREQNDYRDLGRLRIWSSLFSAFVERPLFGHGLNNSAALGETLRTLKFGAFGTYPSSPESAYVQTLVETGVVGFVALLGLLGITFGRALRTIRAGREPALLVGTLAALVALWAGNLTVSAFTTDQHGMLMGLLIGLVFASGRRRE